jgi:threonine/homoserine/homoserine lactone efflux protein
LLIGVVNVVWLFSGVLLTRAFRDPRTNRIVNIAFAVALLASAVLALRA